MSTTPTTTHRIVEAQARYMRAVEELLDSAEDVREARDQLRRLASERQPQEEQQQ